MRLEGEYSGEQLAETERVVKTVVLDSAIEVDWVNDNAMNDEQQQRSLIVGLGKTGLSCARFLSARNTPFLIVDNREVPPALEGLRAELPAAEVQLGAFDSELFINCREIILSPGVSLQTPEIAAAVAAGVPVVGDIDLFARNINAPVIAITGSNGKSTVTEMMCEVLRCAGKRVAMGGNIGIPVLELVPDEDANEEIEFYVLELSSFQLETTHELNAAVSVVLNLSPDHLDRYDDLAHYLAAKQRISRGDGAVIWNRDDDMLNKTDFGTRANSSFGMSEPRGNSFGITLQDGVRYLAKGGQLLMPVDELLLKGSHNIANALAVAALADSVGVDHDAVIDGLKHFSGLPHRMQWIAEKNGINWLNDSKGTNVGATVAALRGLDSPVVLIAGGVGKEADFSSLKPALAGKARAVILIGQDAPLIEDAISGAVSVERAASMDAAVTRAAQLAEIGDVVLLSPACASFDMFAGFEARGDAFISAVKEVLA